MILLSLILLPLLISFLLFFVSLNYKSFFIRLSLLSRFIELSFVGYLAFYFLERNSYSLKNFLELDVFSLIAALSISIPAFFITWYSWFYFLSEMKKNIIGFNRLRQYFVFVNIFISMMYLAIFSTSPVICWIAIESITLSTVLLISFYNKPSALEAAWKYLIINSFGLLLSLFGTFIFLGAANKIGHSGYMISWNELKSLELMFDKSLIKMGFILVLIGYGTKIGLVPMHTWKPDVYSKSPTPLAALFAGPLLSVAIIVLLKFKLVTDVALGSDYSKNLFLFFGFISVLCSALILVYQKNYKRMLAYSSIEQTGIIFLGLALGGIAQVSSIILMFYHSLVKSFLFLVSGNIFLKYSSTKIEKVKNMFSEMPVTSFLFIFGLLIIAGTPPFPVFFSEWFIFGRGIAFYPVVYSVVIFSVGFVLWGFLRAWNEMIFKKDNNDISAENNYEININLLLPLVLFFAVIIIFSFYFPDKIYEYQKLLK